MGSLAFALEHDSAISSTATCPATANGVEAFDALDRGVDTTNGMPWDRLLPWLLVDTRATTPAVRGCPEESLTPQTSPRFDFDLASDLSVQLPFFTNNPITNSNRSSTTKAAAASDGFRHQHPKLHDETGLDLAVQDDACTTLDDGRSPFHTFFFSPSTSTSSLASSASWTSVPSSDTDEAPSTTMPGLITMESATAGPLAHQPADDDEYFARPPIQAADEATANTTTSTTNQWRPPSARSGGSGTRRPASPPIFSRWGRRHPNGHHHHPHRHPSGQLQAPSGRGSTESKVSGSGSSIVKRSPGRSRSSSMQKRQSLIVAGVPQMTREEFEALPLAIQRKYFSTLERLRFARDSGHVDGISQHYDEITHFKRRKPRQDRSVSEQITSRIIRRRSLLESQSPFHTPEPSPSCAELPDQVQRREFTREEQVVLARRLRASVILDAADEAICKLNRRASKKLPGSDHYSPSLSSRRSSMDSHGTRSPAEGSNADIPQSFYDTFRWLDEEEDLDLRLFLDDYHANLRDNMPQAKQQRPSFRRHLSISKIPFGRSSVSSSRPATKDATTPTSPLQSPSGSAIQPVAHGRRKSRALSLITPKHAPQGSITSIDPAAAHYQDPEARLKLRVYLASPQKFDEAIEFGFPSADALSAAPVIGKDGGVAGLRRARQKPSDASAHMRTFLADDDDDDDNISLNSDQASLADPDSPKTPQAFDSKPGPIRPLRLGSTDKDGAKNASEGGGYAQAPASSREMTLRMTLTRPDLRAHEDQIYGWQQRQANQALGRKSTTLAPLAMESVTYVGDAGHKESMSMERMSNFDWNSTTPDKGMMKRFWNRVRRN
ncbi:hypothetical protein OQA88_6725 [Cercophora sp. LCS_1]